MGDSAASDHSPRVAALVLVTGVGPLATDTYLAALPGVQRSLSTSASMAQLTMTAFIVGLAAGQLLFGPISDGRGRRRLILSGCLTFAVTSAVCAVAPVVGMLIAARVVQGAAAGCGAAVGRAVVSDRYEGAHAAAMFGTLTAIGLLAPVVAPAIGGAILTVGDWRSVFAFLTATGALMVAAAFVGIPETLPPERRHGHGVRNSAARMADLLRDRAFRAPVAIQCLATAGFFTYIGGSSFVLQDELGISERTYSLVFATNAAAMAVTSAVFRSAVGRTGAARLRAIGLSSSTAGTVVLAGLALALPHARLSLVWPLLVVIVAGMGLTIPATTTIAQEAGRRFSGTASALQGGLVFLVGAVTTPLTGLIGHQTVRVMAGVMALFFLAAVGVWLAYPARPRPVSLVEADSCA
ncbi:MAG TPA: multidrug effflux MFS transporter [Mycobacteriales bacterium]|nr:multidrug effflux MFS transporter [Mycobacteriales bacterium]